MRNEQQRRRPSGSLTDSTKRISRPERQKTPARTAKRVHSAKNPSRTHSAKSPEEYEDLRERRRRAARIRQMKKKRRRRILLAVLAVAVVAGAGGGGFYFLKETVFKGPVMSYSIKNEFADYQVKDSEKRAASFAADLCVVSGDIPLDSVSLEEGQEGLLLNLDKQEVLYSKGAYERVYPASITKIMTALLAFQYGNMDDVVTITQDNVTLEEGSQVVGFQPGDQVTMDQLVHGLLVYSGNDAASAIATHIGGTEAEFVNMMNDYAAQLGCTGTHFTNPHGLQDENHYTTPYDIYLMLKEALNYPEFTEITQLSSYNVTYKNSDGADMSVSLMATDHYLTGEATAPKGITVLGGKTGTTSDAGNCLALLCQDAYGEPYISIIMGASTKEILYQQMNSLLENVNAV